MQQCRAQTPRAQISALLRQLRIAAQRGDLDRVRECLRRLAETRDECQDVSQRYLYGALAPVATIGLQRIEHRDALRLANQFAIKNDWQHVAAAFHGLPPLLQKNVSMGVSMTRAIEMSSFRAAKGLLQAGARVNDYTVHAVVHGQVRALQFLLQHGANANAKDYSGWTLAHHVVGRFFRSNKMKEDRMRCRMLQLLVNHKANLRALIPNSSTSVLELARQTCEFSRQNGPRTDGGHFCDKSPRVIALLLQHACT